MTGWFKLMVERRADNGKQFDMQPAKISIAVMFVDECVISKTAEAALLLNSYRRDSSNMEGRETWE